MQLLIFIYGLLIGSFLNVCIYRIPKEESIAFPSSHCPKCNTSLKWYDNIPVFSYISLSGKCRYCKSKISPQYPLIELSNPIIYLLLFYKFNCTVDFIFYALIYSILIVITIIDLKEMIIPDSLVITILIFSILHKLLNYFINSSPVNLLNSIGGLILAGGFFILIILISKGGMGGGDATLIGSLGFILGIKNIFLTIFLSFILGAIISIFLLITKIKGKKDPIPFGPFIILGFTITLFWGERLINWYINMFFI
jgi:leader peptidase (prepilin peptidase)/N-methyltransferase